METIELEATKRSEVGKHMQALRSAGKVPAVVYGHGIKSEPLTLELKAAERAYRHAGRSKILSLKVEGGKTRKVLIHAVQQGVAKGELKHLDFYVVKMDEVLTAEVPLRFVGESTAVYKDEGTLVKNIEMVAVECLPGDLPDSLEVDISSLDDFEKTMTLADLVMPSGVKLVEEDLTVIVAKVEAPRTDAQMAQLDEDVNASPEVPESAQEEAPSVVSEESGGDKDRRDKK